MAINYEWDVESYDGEDIVDHNFSDKLSQLPWLLDNHQLLVLVRTTKEGDRSWAYVDSTRMLPKYFTVPDENGNYVDTDVLVPQRFHREIARVACGGR